jgi:hypothetical protein
MKKIFILFFTLILLLSGCGGSGSTSNDNTIETKRITSNTELEKYWDKLDTALEKDQYETTSAYNQRISEFIDSENNDSYTFIFDIYDWYDADTSTLYIYDINLGNDISEYRYGYTMENTRIEAHGLSSYPFYVGYVEGECCYKDTALIYKTLNINSNNAEKLSGGFKIELTLHFDLNLGITSQYYNSIYGGNLYDIIGYVNSVKITNYRDNQTYYENNISY